MFVNYNAVVTLAQWNEEGDSLNLVTVYILGTDPQQLKSKLRKLKEMKLIKGKLTGISRTSINDIYMIGVI